MGVSTGEEFAALENIMERIEPDTVTLDDANEIAAQAHRLQLAALADSAASS
jgi:hypothetical protein